MCLLEAREAPECRGMPLKYLCRRTVDDLLPGVSCVVYLLVSGIRVKLFNASCPH